MVKKLFFEIIEKLKSIDDKYKNAFLEIHNLQCAKNCEYVNMETKINDKDELALFPPVTGVDENYFQKEKILDSKNLEFFSSVNNKSGAIISFIGKVRPTNIKKKSSVLT